MLVRVVVRAKYTGNVYTGKFSELSEMEYQKVKAFMKKDSYSLTLELENGNEMIIQGSAIESIMLEKKHEEI